MFTSRHVHGGSCVVFVSQTKYKKDKEDLANTLFSLLPETLETQFVKEMAETHSEVGALALLID